MFKIILWAIVIYVVYRFITGFVLPVTKVASQMKNKVKEMEAMQRKQQEQMQQQQQTVRETVSPAAGDYIDFEEIKS